MNVCKILPLAVLMTACGISPQDASDELNRSVANPEEWCGWQPPSPDDTDVDKIFNHPDGYGVTASYGCFDGDWDGGFCYAPDHKVHRIRLYQDGQDATWFSKLSNEFGAIRDRMNARGWQVSKWATGNPTPTMEAHTSMAGGPGVLGAADYFGKVFHEFDDGQYITYSSCVATVFRVRVEANWAYQAASPAQQEKYQKNLWDHELGGHCFGLGHLEEEDRLMSAVYHFPGPRYDANLNPTADELVMFEEFQPLD